MERRTTPPGWVAAGRAFVATLTPLDDREEYVTAVDVEHDGEAVPRLRTSLHCGTVGRALLLVEVSSARVPASSIGAAAGVAVGSLIGDPSCSPPLQ